MTKVAEKFKMLMYKNTFEKEYERYSVKINPEYPKYLTIMDYLFFLTKYGVTKLFNGYLIKHRFKRCGKRFLLGKYVEIDYPKYLTVGDFVSIANYCYISCMSEKGVRLADEVRLNRGVWLQVTSVLSNRGVGIEIGERSYIGPYCMLGATGGIKIGKDVTIGAHVDILAENHNYSEKNTSINSQGVSRKGIKIDDDCWIGNRVIILDGVTIGKGSVIGAGSVVTKDVSPHSVVVGNPAKIVKCRSE